MKSEIEIVTINDEVESICRWAAGRAGVIVIVPVVGTIALMANEVYMIIRIAHAYGVKVNESAAVAFLGALGGAFMGQTFATMIPFPPLQIPIGVGVTYAVGKAAQAWIQDGMPTDAKKYAEIYETVKQEAKKMIAELTKHPLKDKPLGDEKKDFTK